MPARFFLIETDSLKVLNNVKGNNVAQVESVPLFTVGEVYLVYVSVRKLYLAVYFLYVFHVNLRHFSNISYVYMVNLENGRCYSCISLKCETLYNNTEYFIMKKN